MYIFVAQFIFYQRFIYVFMYLFINSFIYLFNSDLNGIPLKP